MEILTTERVDFAGYKRLAANVVAPDAPDDELRAVAERLLRRERVDVVVVFVWSSAELVGKVPFDVARVQIARGDTGWSADGRWISGTPDSVHEYVEGLVRRKRIIAVIDRRADSARRNTVNTQAPLKLD